MGFPPHTPYEKAIDAEITHILWERCVAREAVNDPKALIQEAIERLYINGVYSDPYHEAINAVPYL